MPADAMTDSTSTYLLEQRFRYSYAEPAARLQHRLVVVPRAVHGGQRRVDYGLSVSGSSAVVSATHDSFANDLVELRAPMVEEWIEFAMWALVELRGSRGMTPLTPPVSDDARWLASTPLTEPDASLRETARDLLASGATGLDLAERACTRAHEALSYEWGVTDVYTSAASALAGGRGVCQDYAHVMIALCRASGLRARYVSGHLVGEGGSHAWTEVVVPESGSRPDRAVAVAFDPTHDRRAEHGYLTVAVGRDYADVAPTSGTFEGRCSGELSARKRLSLANATGSTLTPRRASSEWPGR
jgi:transglutaminase-like putative cysteine protease